MEAKWSLRKRKSKNIEPLKEKTTNAERAKRYREHLKKDSKKYKEYQEKERERKKLAWRKRTEEKKEADRTKARERQKRFRERQKEMGIKKNTSNTTSKVLTRTEREKKRMYWRLKKRESREKQNSQKKRRLKERDRDYRQKKRNPASGPKRRKQHHIPKDREHYADMVENILENATPKKKEALAKRNLFANSPLSRKKLKLMDHSFHVIKKIVRENKKVKKTILHNLSFLKKYRLNRLLSKYIGVKESEFTRREKDLQERKRRSDAVSDSVKRRIEHFYTRPDISTNLPTSKRIKKDLSERRILDRPIKQTFTEFKELNPAAQPISLSTFKRNKPRNVESTRKQTWYGCLCEVCTNVEQKLRSLRQFAAKNGSNISIKDKYEAVSLTLCGKGSNTFHDYRCLKRECGECGVDRIFQYFENLAKNTTQESVRYTKWERVKKLYKGKEITQIQPVTHCESLTKVITELSEELQSLSEHIFIAAWQQSQFSNLQNKVPKDWVILNMDFSENYSCIAQHEVQSAHWGHQQATVHPTVAFYQCQDYNCEETVIESLVFISNDLNHNAHSVQRFVIEAEKHLTRNRGLTIKKMIQMTDGCAAQYKSKTPFTDISYSLEDFGHPTERHFYGSRHGKGPSDGAGAVVKSAARRAVNGQNIVINNAKDLYQFAFEKLTKDEKHSKRTIFYVDDINHNRPERSQSKTLMGTRKLQCVRSIERNKIATRNLSCFCDNCVNDGTNCINKDYVGPWIIQNMQQVGEGRFRHRNINRIGRTRRGRGEGPCARTRNEEPDLGDINRDAEIGIQNQGTAPRVRVGGPRVRGSGHTVRGRGLRVRGGGFRVRGGGPRVRGGDPTVRRGGPRVRGGAQRLRGGIQSQRASSSEESSDSSQIMFEENELEGDISADGLDISALLMLLDMPEQLEFEKEKSVRTRDATALSEELDAERRKEVVILDEFDARTRAEDPLMEEMYAVTREEDKHMKETDAVRDKNALLEEMDAVTRAAEDTLTEEVYAVTREEDKHMKETDAVRDKNALLEEVDAVTRAAEDPLTEEVYAVTREEDRHIKEMDAVRDKNALLEEVDAVTRAAEDPLMEEVYAVTREEDRHIKEMDAVRDKNALLEEVDAVTRAAEDTLTEEVYAVTREEDKHIKEMDAVRDKNALLEEVDVVTRMEDTITEELDAVTRAAEDTLTEEVYAVTREEDRHIKKMDAVRDKNALLEEVDAVTRAAEDTLTEEVYAVTREEDKHIKETDAVRDKNALLEEVDVVTRMEDTITEELDAVTRAAEDILTEEVYAVTREEDKHIKEMDAVRDKNALLEEVDVVTRMEDTITEELDAVTRAAEDTLTEEVYAVTREEDKHIKEMDAVRDKNALIEEVDVVTRMEDTITEELDAVTSAAEDTLTEEVYAVTREEDRHIKEMDAVRDKNALLEEVDVVTRKEDTITEEPDAVTRAAEDTLTEEVYAVTREEDKHTEETDALTEEATSQQDLFSTGTYVLIKHGTQLLPAVVVDWPAVVYFKYLARSERWIKQDIVYDVESSDVLVKLADPVEEKRGRRSFFHFEDAMLPAPHDFLG